MELESVEFDFVKMIHEVTKPFQYSAQKKGISFEVNIDGPTELHLVGDDGRISQVICNLIGNAIKFTYQGGVVVNVATEAKDTVS